MATHARTSTRANNPGATARATAAKATGAIAAAGLIAMHLTACGPAEGPTHSPSNAADRGTHAASAIHKTASHDGKPNPNATNGEGLSVIATTPILADIARNIVGATGEVFSLMPPGADPHSFEPTLRSVRNVANADLIFTNGLLLEPQAITDMVNNSSPENTPVIPVGQEYVANKGLARRLVEDQALDSVWLGLRTRNVEPGDAVRFQVTDVAGPGTAAAFITGTFGQPEIFFSSHDGLDERDTAELPAGAHTHMSWAFSKPGVYTITVRAGQGEQDWVEDTVKVAVGVPTNTPELRGRTVIDSGHQDLTVDGASKKLSITGDAGTVPLADAVIGVPNRVLNNVPANREYRFLGKPDQEIYLLPQAVLGKHVHGELDPHIWHDAGLMKNVVEGMRDQLIHSDPAGQQAYTDNAAAYLEQLSDLDQHMRQAIAEVPKANRKLVTAHDSFGYLSQAYDLDTTGFITPNPDVQPSARQLIRLSRTLENAGVPAVFVEPSLVGNAPDLIRIAEGLNISVCTLNGDTLDPGAQTYVGTMEANAEQLNTCLGEEREVGAQAAAPRTVSPQAVSPQVELTAQTFGDEETALKQQVTDDEATADPGTEFTATRGHYDLGVQWDSEDGLGMKLRDDSGDSPVWRETEDVVFEVPAATQLTLPEDSGDAYGFTGAAPGDEVWVLPQTENPDAPWLGWNTQSPQLNEQFQDGITLKLLEHQGPGDLSLFLQNGTFDAPQALWSTADAEAKNEIFVDMNTHVHANWVFTQPGVHQIAVEASGIDSEGVLRSSVQVLKFAVDANPAEAHATSWDGPLPTADTVDGAAVTQGEGSGSKIPLFLALGIGALLILGGVLGGLRARKSKKEAGW